MSGPSWGSGRCFRSPEFSSQSGRDTPATPSQRPRYRLPCSCCLMLVFAARGVAERFATSLGAGSGLAPFRVCLPPLPCLRLWNGSLRSRPHRHHGGVHLRSAWLGNVRERFRRGVVAGFPYHRRRLGLRKIRTIALSLALSRWAFKLHLHGAGRRERGHLHFPPRSSNERDRLLHRLGKKLDALHGRQFFVIRLHSDPSWHLHAFSYVCSTMASLEQFSGTIHSPSCSLPRGPKNSYFVAYCKIYSHAVPRAS